ncbi:hypothetical protein L1887_08192 [Cichorium endivia]|nr:hypothetical protein L1887_08192 [Cichorium endivia]
MKGEGRLECQQASIIEFTRPDSTRLGNSLLTYQGRPSLIDFDGQFENIVEEIEAMVHSYTKKPNYIILAISLANQDLATSDAVKISRKVDPRCFGMKILQAMISLDWGSGAIPCWVRAGVRCYDKKLFDMLTSIFFIQHECTGKGSPGVGLMVSLLLDQLLAWKKQQHTFVGLDEIATYTFLGLEKVAT